MKLNSVAVVFFLCSVSLPAAAYIDPGSGSAIMTAVVGFFVAIGMAIKTYWYKLKSLFTGNKIAEADGENNTADNEDSSKE